MARDKKPEPIDLTQTFGLSHRQHLVEIDIDDLILDIEPEADERVEELAESIRQNGRVLVPILVTSSPHYVEDGKERVVAARIAGLTKVPAIILPDDPNLRALARIDANLVRKHLTVLEQSALLKERHDVLRRMGVLARSGGAKGDTVSPTLTTAALGAQVGLGERRLQRLLQIGGGLDAKARDLLMKTPIAEQTTVLLDLAAVKDPAEQVKLAEDLAAGRARSVAEARGHINRVTRRAAMLVGPTVVPAGNAPTVVLYYGWDVLDALRKLPDNSVHCVITSPPYYDLRHNLPPEHPDAHRELGQEKTPEEYIARVVRIMREVRRVLRKDGTLWVNLGDTYSRHKDLLMIPSRVATALQADGWCLRSFIPWIKPTQAMPESVADRPGVSNEFYFMLTQQREYFYDADSVRVVTASTPQHDGDIKGRNRRTGDWYVEGLFADESGNLRCLIANPRPFKGEHTSAYSTQVVEPFVLSSTSGGGCCPKCGAPLARVVEYIDPLETSESVPFNAKNKERKDGGSRHRTPDGGSAFLGKMGTTRGWRPTCEHAEAASGPVPCTVLDIFSGSATTGLSAIENGRNYIGIDLNEACLEDVDLRLQGVKVGEFTKVHRPRRRT